MSRWIVLVLFAGGLACTGTEGPAPGDGPLPGTGGHTGVGGAGTGGHYVATGGRATGGSTTTGGAVGTGGAGTGGAKATGGAGASSVGAYTDVPCDVAKILKTSCGMCHGATPSYGAPMSLIRAADFSKKARDGSRTVGQAVIARINDDVSPMPQAPTPRLTSAENGSLTTWIQGGAKSAACSDSGSEGTQPPETNNDPTDPDVTCYDIKARNSSGAKFSVPNTPDLYHCFSYAPPWGTDKVHLVSWRPIIDNRQVIHHWLLYNENSAVTDKTDADCAGAHPNAQLVVGWAPGGPGTTMPPDVGQDMSGAGFTLETHYNNTGTAASPDGSGVHVCVTKKLRKYEAGIHWLGTELILLPAGGQAAGLCSPSAKTPVTIISSTPHMHLQGRHMTTVINRANGTKETLIDKPFDFQTQIGYQTPTTIMPGDTLTTTCTYGGQAIYGEGTKQEMCYNFVLAYPNGGLSSGSLLRKNGCTGL